MAISTKSMSILFLLSLFFTQINARESQFFSKVTATPNTINNNNKNRTETTLPTKGQESLTREEQEPSFMQETQNDNYGLYGQEQENSQFSTTTKLGASPYTTPTSNYHNYNTKSPTEETYSNNYPSSNTKYYNNNNNNNNYYHNNNNQYNNNGHEEQQQQREEDFGHETSLEESSYTTKPTNKNQYHYNNNNNNNKNVEKQGMSDTRYMENGRYFYDVQNEKNYYPTTQYQNTKNSYSTRQYYNNNNNNNNEQYREYSNTNGNYQNQEEESQEGEEEQYVP